MNDSSDYQSGVAVVVPCFNEEERLDASQFCDFIAKHPKFHFVLVDDGSSDNTLGVFKSMQSHVGTTQVEIVRLEHNSGKAEATRQGILHACQPKYRVPRAVEMIGYLDADLATPLDEFKELARIANRSPSIQAVLGSRLSLSGHAIERKAIRRTIGGLFASLTSLFFRLGIRDTQCGAKLFRYSPWLEQVCQRPFADRWLFDVELLIRIRGEFQSEFSKLVFEQPLRFWRDESGSRLKFRDFASAPLRLLRLAVSYNLLPDKPASQLPTIPFTPNTASAAPETDSEREGRKAA